MRLLETSLVAVGVVALLAAATRPVHRPAITFEKEPRLLFPGRSPKFVVKGAQGLQLLSVRPAENGPGQDLFFQASSDGGDEFDPPLRVNNVSGEVSDHGENSPHLVASPDRRYLYAVWGARDPKDPMGGSVRFARSPSMRPTFSPAITVNDDGLPVSHSFQSLAVGPDGTVYVAWLDGRDKAGEAHAGHSMEGNSSIYLARSIDGGRTFQKNVRVTGNVCPCCRVTIAFVTDKVVLGWRMVEPGDVRDIHIATSLDKGQTWSKPTLVARDGWKINGCPHVGPAMAALGSRLYVAWFTEGSGDPAINLAFSDDGLKTFSPKQRISGDTFDPTHPQLTANDEKVALVFQARSAKQSQGWGRVAVYYREIYPGGATSELIRAAEGKANVSFPNVALGLSGRIFIGWTQTLDGAAGAYCVRGRSLTKRAPSEE
jgi:hypothetical protein